MSASRRIATARLVAFAAFPLLLLGLASCSAGTDTPTSEQTSTSKQDYETWELKFAQCMRDAGVDYEDPSGDGRQTAGKSDTKTLEAAKKCTTELGEPPARSSDGNGNGGGTIDLLKAAQCLRENGVDVPDPESTGGLTIPADVSPETIKTCGLPTGSAGAGISGPTK